MQEYDGYLEVQQKCQSEYERLNRDAQELRHQSRQIADKHRAALQKYALICSLLCVIWPGAALFLYLYRKWTHCALCLGMQVMQATMHVPLHHRAALTLTHPCTLNRTATMDTAPACC